MGRSAPQPAGWLGLDSALLRARCARQPFPENRIVVDQVRRTLAAICCVAAPCGVRLPPHTLRVTTAGRIACSACQFGRFDTQVLQAGEEGGPLGPQVPEETAIRRVRDAAGEQAVGARLKTTDGHDEPVPDERADPRPAAPGSRAPRAAGGARRAESGRRRAARPRASRDSGAGGGRDRSGAWPAAACGTGPSRRGRRCRRSAGRGPPRPAHTRGRAGSRRR